MPSAFRIIPPKRVYANSECQSSPIFNLCVRLITRSSRQLTSFSMGARVYFIAKPHNTALVITAREMTEKERNTYGTRR